jgi:hypothetical protein
MTDLETALALNSQINHTVFWRIARDDLPTVTFRALMLRYTFFGVAWHPPREIAGQLGISKAQAEQEITEALRLMRHRERRREYTRD